MEQKVRIQMDSQLQEEMKEDLDLAKTMTTITSPEMVLELTNKLIYYMDIINTSISEYEYKLSQLKGKLKVLQEYVRVSKQQAVNLSIQRSYETKKY